MSKSYRKEEIDKITHHIKLTHSELIIDENQQLVAIFFTRV